MATYLMFGDYSSKGLKEMSSKRTESVIDLITKNNGKVHSMYAILGEHDLLFIVDFPNAEHALKASVGLNRLTDISFNTSMAVTVEEFDKMMTDV